MNSTQRGAIYGLILTGCLLFIPLFDYLEPSISKLTEYLLLAGWFVLMIGPVLLIERHRKATQTPFDERDKQICIRAAIAAFIVLFMAGTAAYTIALFWFESFTLGTQHLPILIYGTLAAFIFLLSAGVLIQYLSFHKRRSA
jgi:hypothetical protein